MKHLPPSSTPVPIHPRKKRAGDAEPMHAQTKQRNAEVERARRPQDSNLFHQDTTCVRVVDKQVRCWDTCSFTLSWPTVLRGGRSCCRFDGAGQTWCCATHRNQRPGCQDRRIELLSATVFRRGRWRVVSAAVEDAAVSRSKLPSPHAHIREALIELCLEK